MAPIAWEDFFTTRGAYWRYGGDPRHPHAVLTSGKHSDGYLNASRLIEHPLVLGRIGHGLRKQFKNLLPDKPDWVVGSPYGSITLAFELARQLNCKAGFTERDEESKRLLLKRFELKPRARVLVVDDVITTGGTTRETIVAAQCAADGVEVLPCVCAIANRSGQSHLDGRTILCLIAPRFNVWEPAACPLCEQGSVAIRPKGNWARLMQP